MIQLFNGLKRSRMRIARSILLQFFLFFRLDLYRRIQEKNFLNKNPKPITVYEALRLDEIDWKITHDLNEVHL